MADQSPWPVRRRRSWIVAAVLLALLGAGGLVLGATAPAEGRGPLLVGSPLLLLAAALVYLARARWQGVAGLAVGTVPDLGERGVMLAYSAALSWGYVVSMVYCSLFFGLIAVGGVASAGHGLGARVVWLVVALLICAYLAWCALDLLRGRLRRGFVALTPRGFYHRSWAMCAYAPWPDVLEVTAADVNGPLVQVLVAHTPRTWIRRTSPTWRQGELLFAPNLVIRGNFLAADPALLYHGARFYHANPAMRTELLTDAAIDRFRALHQAT